jgi:hypothetical protein
MSHVLIAPVIIGSALPLGGGFVLILQRWVLRKVPERQSSWN